MHTMRYRNTDSYRYIHANKHNQIYTQKHVDFVSIFVVLVLAAGLPVPCALGLGCVTLEDHTRFLLEEYSVGRMYRYLLKGNFSDLTKL